ncbi:MAG: hypothetical protein K0R29_1925 [Pseudobdellovibrio sp.]|jgi:hypothetical protein|nr:hypothetical protein [Pseudobdellovibrio sp.]
MKEKHKRTKFLIYPEIQMPLVYIGITLVLIISLIQILTLIIFIYKYRYGDAQFHWSSLQEVVFNIFYYRARLLLILVVPFLLICFFLGRYLLFISNKFAGPIYKIEKELDQINETGTFREIQIRSSDFLQKFVEKLNQSYKNIKN